MAPREAAADVAGPAPERWQVQPAAPLFAGLALGVTNSLSSALGSPYGPLSLAPMLGVRPLEYLAAWLGSAWAWALLAFAVGWFTQAGLRSATVRATFALMLAVVAYYACDAALGVNASLSTGEIAWWSLIALGAAPVMGCAGWLARRPARWSLVPGLAAPAVMAADTLLRPSGTLALRPWSQWLVYAAAAALAAALASRALRLPTRRHRCEAD